MSINIPTFRSGLFSGAVLRALRQLYKRHLTRWLLHRCEGAQGVSLNVAVLLSGGVDSSLALHLLKKAGHQVTAFYLQIWFQEDFANFWGSCPWEDDLKVCQEVSSFFVLITVDLFDDSKVDRENPASVRQYNDHDTERPVLLPLPWVENTISRIFGPGDVCVILLLGLQGHEIIGTL